MREATETRGEAGVGGDDAGGDKDEGGRASAMTMLEATKMRGEAGVGNDNAGGDGDVVGRRRRQCGRRQR